MRQTSHLADLFFFTAQGDFVDRGRDSIETVFLLFALQSAVCELDQTFVLLNESTVKLSRRDLAVERPRE
jgi:hypothetical protein